MSTLIVEICQINDIIPHPNADRLEIAIVKGWEVCVSKSDNFKTGQKVAYFPPDSILPPEISNGPNDKIPGRLNVSQYLVDVKINDEPRKRVKATRLRGVQSFGIILKLNEKESELEIGTDVKKLFNIEKWEPPAQIALGDADTEESNFDKYTSIQQWQNFPDSFTSDDEVVITEKCHGTNSRVGLIKNSDGVWDWMCGSHSMRRKKYVPINHCCRLSSLLSQSVTDKLPNIGDILEFGDAQFRIVINIKESDDAVDPYVIMSKCRSNGEIITKLSMYWLPLTNAVKNLLALAREESDIPNVHSVIIHGEIYGHGIQKGMAYGLSDQSYMFFDLSVNGRFLPNDKFESYIDLFSLPKAPVLYRGLYSKEKVKELTCGDTTICDPNSLKGFRGREGVVIKHAYEKIMKNGRRLILKSINADYQDRTDISDSH